MREAGGLPANQPPATTNSRYFLGWAIRNRFNDGAYFENQTTYQAAITVAAEIDTNVDNGPEPELTNAARAFSDKFDPTGGCQGWWSPTPDQWDTVEQALNSGTATLPSNVGAPFSYFSQPEITQFVIFNTVGTNETEYRGQNVPAFIFVRKRSPGQQAVVRE